MNSASFVSQSKVTQLFLILYLTKHKPKDDICAFAAWNGMGFKSSYISLLRFLFARVFNHFLAQKLIG